MNSSKFSGVSSLVLLALVFASMGLFARYLSTNFTLFQQVYLRVFAGLIIGILVFWKHTNIFDKISRVTSREVVVLTARSVGQYVLGVTLFSFAVLSTKYANVSAVMAVPFTGLIGILFLKEKITIPRIVCIIVAFIGAVVLSIKGLSLASFGVGELLALLGALGFAMNYALRRLHTDLFNNRELTLVILAVGGALVFLISLFMGEGVPLLGWSWKLFGAVVLAGSFNIINQFLTNYGFEKVEAVVADVILHLEVVFAILFGFLLYAEVPKFWEIIGMVLIVGSVILLEVYEYRSNNGHEVV